MTPAAKRVSEALRAEFPDWPEAQYQRVAELAVNRAFAHRHKGAKRALTDQQIKDMLLSGHLSLEQLARKYKVSKNTAYKVRAGLSYRHISRALENKG